MRLLYLLLFILISSKFALAQSNVIKDGNSYYFADRVIVKYKNKLQSLNKSSTALYSKYGIISEPTFENQNSEAALIDLSNIRTLKYSAPYDPNFFVIKII